MAQIRAQIQMEMERLKQEDDTVRREIEQALDKENPHKENPPSDGASGPAPEADPELELGSTKNSAALFGDLDELRYRLRDVADRPDSAALSAAKEDGEAVVSCYRCVGQSSINHTLTGVNHQNKQIDASQLLA
jgi:MICOS complex subunit MIC19